MSWGHAVDLLVQELRDVGHDRHRGDWVTTWDTAHRDVHTWFWDVCTCWGMRTCHGHVGLCEIVFIRAGVNMKASDHRVGRRSDRPSEGGGECHSYQKL